MWRTIRNRLEHSTFVVALASHALLFELVRPSLCHCLDDWPGAAFGPRQMNNLPPMRAVSCVTFRADISCVSLTDDEWMAQPRVTAADGACEPVLPALRAGQLLPPTPASPRCAFCTERPPLEVYPRREVVTERPLYYCPRCYGFWALPGTPEHGVHDPYDDHPAFRAAPAPPRCRACFGHLAPGGTCTRCDKSRIALCPGCGEPMTPYEQRGVRLDQCPNCQGVWFDVGEIALVYGLQPVQGLAASSVDETATADEPPAWLLIAESVLGFIFGFRR